MNPIRIGMIGSGWRAQTFMRIIRELPEVFSLQAVYFRNPDKAAAHAEKWPGTAFCDFEQFLSKDVDFILLSIPCSAVPEYLEKIFAAKIPVLCETPPAGNLEGLENIWELTCRLGGKIQIAEQYFLQPYHAAVRTMVESGVIGDVNSMKLSMMHDYHGMSVIRKLLSEGFNRCTVSGKYFAHPVAATCGRGGMEYDKRIVTDGRKTALLEFEDGKICFFDFAGEQYFNYLRSRHLSVQGTMGEIWDDKVNYLTDDGYPVCTEIRRVDTGHNSNLEGYYHRGIMLGERFVYRNPFEKYLPRLNDDEIAMASLMTGMKTYIDTGVPIYPLEEAIQDTYLGLLMSEAISTGKPVTSSEQAWYPKK